MKTLTIKQAQCLSIVRSFHIAHDRGPSHAELADAMGVRCKSTAARTLSALQRKGKVAIRYGVPRGVAAL